MTMENQASVRSEMCRSTILMLIVVITVCAISIPENERK
jgi:hypothetical protein